MSVEKRCSGAAAVALRWMVGPLGAAVLLLVAGLIWALAVPLQIALGWLVPWIVAIPLVAIAASVAILVPGRRHRS